MDEVERKLFPTRSLMQKLADHGCTWNEVLADLAGHRTVTPSPGSATRRAVTGRRFRVFVEPAPQRAPGAYVALGVREVQPTDEEPGDRVVGVETPGPRSSRRGGRGSRWPTTFSELEKRCRALGARIVPGRTHRKVVWDDHLVVLPASMSDHRSVLNAAQELKRQGLDVSRDSLTDGP